MENVTYGRQAGIGMPASAILITLEAKLNENSKSRAKHGSKNGEAESDLKQSLLQKRVL